MAQKYASPYANLSGTELVDRLKEDLASNKWAPERYILGQGLTPLSPLESKTRLGRVMGMQNIGSLFEGSHDDQLKLAKEAYESALLLSWMRDAVVDNGIYDLPFNPAPENPFSNERPLGRSVLGYAIRFSETLAHGLIDRSNATQLLAQVKKEGIKDRYFLYLALAMSYSRDVNHQFVKHKMDLGTKRAVEEL